MFISRQITIAGTGELPNLNLRPIEFDDLHSLPSPVNEDVTRFLAPPLAKMVEGLCAADRNMYDKVATDEDMAFWGVYFQERLLAMAGLFSIVSNRNREVKARSFCGVFDSNNFGKRIATRVMPVRSWYGLVERNLDLITSYVAEDNTRSLRAVVRSGYFIMGEALVPGTDIPGVKLYQFNPRFDIDMIQDMAAVEAAEFGATIDPATVARSYITTKQLLEKVESKIV